MGSGEAKELIGMTHGDELRVEGVRNAGGRGYRIEGNKGEKKMGQM